MEDRFGAPRVLLTISCTSALEIAALLCDLDPGDEVVLPSYTFASTANAAVLWGVTPVLVDIRPDTLNINERLIEAAVTPRTRQSSRSITPVSPARWTRSWQSPGATTCWASRTRRRGSSPRYKGQRLGTIGHMGCYSFHETKNFSCGEGGALVINDPSVEKRAGILRLRPGTN